MVHARYSVGELAAVTEKGYSNCNSQLTLNTGMQPAIVGRQTIKYSGDLIVCRPRNLFHLGSPMTPCYGSGAS